MTDVCGICLDELVTNIKALTCNHSFHTECIDLWTERCNSCPFCRREIITDYVKLIQDGIISGNQILEISDYLSEDDIFDLAISRHINSHIITQLVLESKISLQDFLCLYDQGCINIIDIEIVFNNEYTPSEFKNKLFKIISK